MSRASFSSPMPPERPSQFTLRQLFIAIAIICLFGGMYACAQAAPEWGPTLLIVAVLFCAGVLIRVSHQWPAIQVVVVGLALWFTCWMLLPALITPREAADRMKCGNHLKQIGMALQNYHDVFGSFPPAYVADATGKPMHSWRVLILPFASAQGGSLYDRYNFNEPWNGPNNSKLASEMPEFYRCPSRSDKQPKMETSYVAVVGPQTMWPGEKATKLSDITDGTSNTVAVIETENSGIHWMEPRDLSVTQMPMAIKPARGQRISSPHPNVALAVYLDGHTYGLAKDTPPETLRAVLSIAGGETIGDY